MTVRRRLLIGAMMGVILSACAAPAVTITERDTAVDELASPLAIGVTEISIKSFIQPDVENMFAAALTGMSVIDRTLTYDTTERRLTVRRGKFVVARVPRSSDRSIDSHVNDIVTLLTLARRASPSLGMASSEAMLKALYDGGLSRLDSYSHYAGRVRAAHDRGARSGSIGVGLEMEIVPSGVQISAIVKNGPADKAGILVGDVITHINDKSVGDISLAATQRRLDGSLDSSVTLTVERGGAAHRYTLQRKRIIADSVTSQMLGSVLHVKISTFNERTASALAETVTRAGKIQGLILDLRSDPGGLLDQAIAVADLFLSKGTIVSLKGRHPGATQFYAASEGEIAANVPIVLLMDGLSASSSEILAAALQENNRALIVGTASVGKGTVQTLVPLPNEGELSITWARASGPKGELLDNRGTLPDLCTTSPPTRGRQNAGDVIAALIRERFQGRPIQRPQDIAAARAACRPEPRRNQALDTEIARQLLTDPGLRAALRLPDFSQSSLSH